MWYCTAGINHSPILMTRPDPRILISLFCLCLLQAPVSRAAALTRVSDLYSFEVVVANTSVAERTSGLEKGLEQVMVRVTGDKRIGTHPAAGGLFSQAENYLQKYGYDEREVLEPAEGEVEEGSDQPSPSGVFDAQQQVKKELLLRGRFEPAVLEKALRQAGLPVWDAKRPQILMLGTVEAEGESLPTTDETLQPILQDAAALRGLPLQLPGIEGMDARSIWKGDRFALDDAARAAGVDFVHWSRVSRQSAGADDAGWVVEAALYQQGELVREWYFNASSEEVALRRQVDELTDWVAGRYAVASQQGGRSVVGLYVSGVEDLSAYARVQALLAELGAVEKLELVAVSSRGLIYRITTRSDARQFENNLALNRRLVPEDASAQHSQAPIWLGEIELYYRLQ